MIKVSVRLFSVVILACGLIVSAAPAKKVNSAPTPSPVRETYYGNFEYELQTGITGGGIESKKIANETNTIVEGQASVTKVIKSNIQIGAEAHFMNQSGGGGSSYFEILGLGIYNFDTNLKDSLYAKFGAGMLNIVNDKSKNEAKPAFMIAGGKRIPVLDRVAYTPEGRIVIVDGTTRFQILALNFSIFY